MSYLVDTNILLRWSRPGDPRHAAARAAINELIGRGDEVFITAQNVVEFWNVATRPADRNGFGMTLAEVDAEVRQLEDFFPLLPETPEVYRRWRALVVAAGVSGVQVHDARLAAVMHAHGITHLLTFNSVDYMRFGIAVVEPGALPLSPPPTVEPTEE